MLQSIQFIGTGPPTYVYDDEKVGATDEFYYVFAAETKRYKEQRAREDWNTHPAKKRMVNNVIKMEEELVVENKQKESLQELYQREYGRRESFLWKQR